MRDASRAIRAAGGSAGRVGSGRVGSTEAEHCLGDGPGLASRAVATLALDERDDEAEREGRAWRNCRSPQAQGAPVDGR